MSIINLTPTQLRQAADLKEKIEKLQTELNRLQGATAGSVSAPATKPAKKKISAAGIAKIRAAQKARWAAIKSSAKSTTAAKPVPVTQPAKQGRKKMSAEARAKIAAAARDRWAKVRAAKATKK